MLTNRTTQWVAGTALLCVALLTVTWLFLVSPRRSEATRLREENTSAQNQNDQLEVQIAELRAQFARLPESQAQLADILAQMPPDAGMPRLVRDLDAMAANTGVTLASIAPGSPQTLTTTAEGAPAGSAAGSATAPAAGVGGSGAGAGTGANAAGVAESTVVSVPVTIVLSGDYFQTVAFLKQLQTQMPRAFLVSSVQMAASGGQGGSATSGLVQVTLSGSVFSLPGMGTDALTTSVGTTEVGAAKSPIGSATPAPTATAPAGGATAVPTASAGSAGASPAASATGVIS